MAKDVILEGRDLQITGGDFVVNKSDAQHEELLMSTAPGQWTAYPSVGIDFDGALLDDESPVALIHRIRGQLEADGATVHHISQTTTGISVKAHYD